MGAKVTFTNQSTASSMSEREVVRIPAVGRPWPLGARVSMTQGDVYHVADQGNEHAMWVELRTAELAIRVGGQLAALTALPPGWDSYGARPVEEEVTRAALPFLVALLTQGFPTPFVVPTPAGGLSIEWHRASRELTVGIEPDSRVLSAFSMTPLAWSGRPICQEMVGSSRPLSRWTADQAPKRHPWWPSRNRMTRQCRTTPSC